MLEFRQVAYMKKRQDPETKRSTQSKTKVVFTKRLWVCMYRLEV